MAVSPSRPSTMRLAPPFAPRPALLGLALLALPTLSAVAPQAARASREAVGQEATAPDGRPGFGHEVQVKDLRRLFLARHGDDMRFVAELRELAAAVRAQMANLERIWAARGWFGLLPAASPRTLVALCVELTLARGEAEERLSRGGPTALVLAEMLADPRARLRAEVLAGVERELYDLKGGLAVFGAHFDGWAEIDELDVSRIGPRVDLAAATLRATRLDLDALRADEAPDPEALALLRAAARGEQRGVGISRTLSALEARQRAMRAMLATARLAPKLEALRLWRASALEEAAGRLPEVRRLLPEAPEGREPGPDVARLSNSERHTRAAILAGEALALDPLHDELCYWAGVAEDMQWGSIRSRKWFDRFLALRGIRSHDDKSYELERLDALERDALERMTQRATPLPPFPPR